MLSLKKLLGFACIGGLLGFALSVWPHVIRHSAGPLSLIVTAHSNAEKQLSHLNIKMENSGEEPIEYVDHQAGHGLDFKFVDQNGLELIAEESWDREHTPPSRDHSIRIHTKKIGKGEFISYDLVLQDALPSDWLKVAAIYVTWYQYGETEFQPNIACKLGIEQIRNNQHSGNTIRFVLITSCLAGLLWFLKLYSLRHPQNKHTLR